MAKIIAFNITLEKIIKEVEKYDKVEQESILAYLRARHIQKQPRKPLAAVSQSIRMATIDSIKHKSRNYIGQRV